ncbi:MAG: amidohydrolase family protein [Beijerinckiaceae bacterium]
MRIDAHQHFWSIARKDYGWLTPDLTPLWRDFGPEHLAPLLAANSIDKTILVQAAPTEAETLYLLSIAENTPFVAGVVGWTDFSAPDAPSAIAKLAQHPLLLGLRPMVQDIPQQDWLARPDLIPAFESLCAHDLVFDALVLPQHLPFLLTVAERHPELTIVIDHAAKPHIRKPLYEPWRTHMRALAHHPNVLCKLSGLVTEAAADWTVGDLRPVTADVLAFFGPQRLIWGSDWPVATLAADYGRWVETTAALLADLNPPDRAGILGGNAKRIYGRSRGRFAC